TNSLLVRDGSRATLVSAGGSAVLCGSVTIQFASSLFTTLRPPALGRTTTTKSGESSPLKSPAKKREFADESIRSAPPKTRRRAWVTSRSLGGRRSAVTGYDSGRR